MFGFTHHRKETTMNKTTHQNGANNCGTAQTKGIRQRLTERAERRARANKREIQRAYRDGQRNADH